MIALLDEEIGRIGKDKIVEVCKLDFQKAFDFVNYWFLNQIIRTFGVNTWIADVLKSRFFKVLICFKTTAPSDACQQHEQLVGKSVSYL